MTVSSSSVNTPQNPREFASRKVLTVLGVPAPEVGLCSVGPAGESPRMAFPDEFSADEIHAALILTRRAADAQFWLAHDLLTRLPAVHAAMDTGLGGAQWRFAITDEHGQLLHCGITRARPIGAPTRMASCRAIVEVQIPAATLRAFDECTTKQGAWACIVTDLLHQLDRGTAGQDCSIPRRAPGAVLRRYLEARDRSCVMIGCRAPARTADKDHTRDHSDGGPTTADNLGAACRHDHRLKHEGGWRLHQSQPGHFHWTSRLGHSYHRRPPPILESLPDPLALDRPLISLRIPEDTGWEDSQIWMQPPEPESRPPAEPDSRDDIPPF